MSVCPRTGQPCPHAKVFAVTEITPQGVVEIQCCQKCAVAMPIMVTLPSLPKPVSVLHQMLGSVLGLPTAEPQSLSASPSLVVELPKCVGCGMTTVDIEKAGRFGCENCYSSFTKEIDIMLRRIHKAITHYGKVPQAWKARQASKQTAEKFTAVDRGVATVKKHVAISVENKIELLEAKMNKHVEKEEYEKAAILRDVIKQFKTSLLPVFSDSTPLSEQSLSGQSPLETPSVSPEDLGTVSEEP